MSSQPREIAGFHQSLRAIQSEIWVRDYHPHVSMISVGIDALDGLFGSWTPRQRCSISASEFEVLITLNEVSLKTEFCELVKLEAEDHLAESIMRTYRLVDWDKKSFPGVSRESDFRVRHFLSFMSFCDLGVLGIRIGSRFVMQEFGECGWPVVAPFCSEDPQFSSLGFIIGLKVGRRWQDVLRLSPDGSEQSIPVSYRQYVDYAWHEGGGLLNPYLRVDRWFEGVDWFGLRDLVD